MKSTLKNYPKYETHAVKNYWKDELERELREMQNEMILGFGMEPVSADFNKGVQYLIKKILGET